MGVGFHAAAADVPTPFSVMKDVPLAELMTVEQLNRVVGSGPSIFNGISIFNGTKVYNFHEGRIAAGDDMQMYNLTLQDLL